MKSILKKLNKMRMKKKLMVSFIIITLLASISGILAAVMIELVDIRYSDALVNYGFSQGDIGKVLGRLGQIDGSIHDSISFYSTENQDAATEAYENQVNGMDEYFAALEKRLTSSEEEGYYEAAVKNWGEYLSLAEELMQKGRTEDTKIIAEVQDRMVEELDPIYNELYSAMSDMMSLKVETGNSLSTSLSSFSIITIMGVVALIIASSAIAIWFGKMIAVSIAKPMQDCSQRLVNLAEGDLNSEIPVVETEDEVGDLANATQKIVGGLKCIIEDIGYLLDEMANGNFNISTREADSYKGDFGPMLLSVKKINMELSSSLREIQDSSNQVATAAEQMARGATELAEGATEQAGAVEELYATTTDVASQVETNAKNTGEANTKANEVGKQAEISNEKMGQMTDAMARISQTSNQIVEIINTIDAIASQTNLLSLNASIEAARAGEAGKGFAVVASQIKDLSAHTTQSAEDVVRYVGEIRTGIDSLVESIDSTAKQLQSGNESVHQTVSDMKIMNERINTISSAIDTIHNEISNQSALTQTFVASIDSIADSYDVLYEECVGTGQHLYHISRDIDRARSDMARKNSNLSTLDWMTVFEIDHLIFTWRVYNNLADFEKLKITQLNNPKGCKLGKWLYAQTDHRITGSPAYRQVIADHEAIHKHACDSWNAKDSGDRDKALKHFSLAYDAFQKFVVSIHGLREVVKSTGETAETDIKIFNM